MNDSKDHKAAAEPTLDCRVMRDNRRVYDNFMEVVATALHYFERTDKIDLSTCSYKELMDLQDGWLERYQTDVLFHAKVQSIVGRLMQALDAYPTEPPKEHA